MCSSLRSRTNIASLMLLSLLRTLSLRSIVLRFASLIARSLRSLYSVLKHCAQYLATLHIACTVAALTYYIVHAPSLRSVAILLRCAHNVHVQSLRSCPCPYIAPLHRANTRCARHVRYYSLRSYSSHVSCSLSRCAHHEPRLTQMMCNEWSKAPSCASYVWSFAP
jgi:hypothetical protein